MSWFVKTADFTYKFCPPKNSERSYILPKTNYRLPLNKNSPDNPRGHHSFAEKSKTAIMMRKTILVAAIVLAAIISNAQGISINTAGNPPDSSAMLDVQSTNKCCF